MPFSRDHLENWTDGCVESEGAVTIAEMSLRRLRSGIQNQEISFPSQVPVFACQSRAEIQWRMVELYFVRNWSCADLGERYGVTLERARQLISQWVRRATVLGYLQEIPANAASAAKPDEQDQGARAQSASIPSVEMESESLALIA
jgi:hypothetical protein